MITSTIVGLTALMPLQAGLLGKAAPDIDQVDAAGKPFRLRDSLNKGPVLVYFISTTCPVTDAASKYYERIHKAFPKDKFTVVGIVNDEKEGFIEWNKEHKLTFPVVCDPQYKVIRAYAVSTAPTSFLIGPNGRVTRVWKGYSEGYLKETAGVVATYLSVEAPKIDFSGAPKSVAVG